MAQNDLPNIAEPAEFTVSTPGTSVGSDTAFGDAADYVSLVADKDIFFAWSAAALSQAAAGKQGARHFAAARERRVIPWDGRGFHVVNAVAGESPKVYVEGWL